MEDYIIRLADCRIGDVGQVGGKNASLGEMIGNLAGLGVRVPGGFATTAAAYREFLQQDGLDEKIHVLLDKLDVDDIPALTKTGSEIRQMIMDTPLPGKIRDAVSTAWDALKDGEEITVAVRSSATAEDLPEASFAGQQETLLNVTGLDQIVAAIHEVYASLFNDRAISYRVHQNFEHRLVALSVGVQRMVRSDLGSAGVAFTLDTESGFRDVIFITSSYGLGETVVQGAVNPDEFYVHKSGLAAGHKAILRRNIGSKAIKMIYSTDSAKRVVTVDVDEADRRQFSLTDEDVENLAGQAALIEKHYGRPMDIEWGKDGSDGQLYILQARP
ncbi:MAG: PEP/pyruvate-binding domain-containing protein, partial [Gammaproteobacteria bacterium]